ncbi:MAG: hypothetical protein K6A44_06545 [bacterium]|nr:hypothetical protein [bacterium]
MAINPISPNNCVKPEYSSIFVQAKADSDASKKNKPGMTQDVAFKGVFSNILPSMFTDKYKFSSYQEKEMYKELSANLVGKDKANIEILYRTGRLQNRKSNDGSSTIQNLYNIYKKPRIQGLDAKIVLSETLERLANPFVINQKFGKIPVELASQVLREKSANNPVQVLPNEPKSPEDMRVENSASCVAASIEFSLADKKPAEFARFIEGLSSPQMEVVQNVKFDNLNKNIVDAVHLLNMFNVKPLDSDWTSTNVKIAPDRDAIIRARVQNTYERKPNPANPQDAIKPRASVDVLLQSAFMQLGSQNTYNSLTDKRYGSLNARDTGLTEFEKTFVESVVGNDGEKTSVVYQNVDGDILKGYFHPTEVVEKNILDTLATNRNVIIGITETDSNKRIIGGHEITVIGSKKVNGELFFICNDTDDDHVGALEVKASDLIPKIHHAGIPVDVLGEQLEPDKSKELLKQLNGNKAIV